MHHLYWHAKPSFEAKLGISTDAFNREFNNDNNNDSNSNYSDNHSDKDDNNESDGNGMTIVHFK